MNILEKANNIVNERSDEKHRQYGDFSESMERAARIASDITGKKVLPQEMYLYMVAIKLSREAFKHKEDNLCDAVAYLGALNNYLEDKK